MKQQKQTVIRLTPEQVGAIDKWIAWHVGKAAKNRIKAANATTLADVDNFNKKAAHHEQAAKLMSDLIVKF